MESNFCSYCGTKIKSGSAAGAKAVKKPSGNKKPQTSVRRGSAKNSKKKTVMSYAPVIIVLVVIAGILITILSLAPGSRSTGSKGVSVVSGQSDNWEAEVLGIAANFNCPCGECGITPLDTCTCDAPRGAIEVKTYIRELLGQGLSKFDVVRLVEEEYGNRR
jgi:hypothetical protein